MQESEQREVRESEMNHDPSPSSLFDERAGPHLGENSSDKLLCSSHQSNRKNPSLTSSQHHHQHHHHHHHQHHQHQHHHHQHHHRTTMDLVFKGITFIEPSEQRQRLGSQLFKSLTCIGRRSSSVVSKAERPIREAHTGRDTYPNASAGRKILDNVSGFTKSGQVLGVLGPSGSGKTTLLNILSGRSKPDQGCVTLNSCTLNKQLRRKIAYVLQHDIFFPDLTLRQTLVYTAMLRLPDSMSKSQKMIHVQNVIDLLELQQCENTIIGDILHRGLSGGEKKRVNIACELLSNPSVMLLDEPTSGLDSSTALGIMKFLKDYAMKERKTIVASVHQPSSQIFYLFDKLLLLSNGQLAYFGDTEKVIPFFSRIGFEITPNYNPADFMMERIKGSEEDRLRIIQAAEELEKTPSTTHRSPKHHHQNHISNQSNSLSHHNQSISNVNHRGEDINRDQFGNEEDHGDGKEEMIENQSQALWTSHTENSNESRSCQESGNDGNGGHGCLENMKDIELRVVIDPCSKKMHKIYSKIVNDDDSGRSSWTDTDRSSTSTFSSSSLNGSTEEMYFGRERYNSSRCSSTNKAWNSDRKWPTSFWTQCKVLIERNFYESRGRLLSKLNWIQTIGLGLVTGLLWLQIPRTENSINDIRGWMFFASSYWMLFALFGALVSIPPEKEVVNKERASGAYRLSAYYIAKLIGELPPTITLPTVFHMISYSMFSSYSLTTFLLQWLFLILNSIVSQTIGFVIGVTSNDLELSITISALYSVTTNLFGGFYSTVIPSWLTWVKYFSIVHYAFHNMQIIEIKYGPPIRCSLTASILPFCMKNNGSFVEKDDLIIPPSIILEHLDPSSQQPFPIWLNTLILLLFLFIFQIFGYLVLRFFRKPK